MKNLYQRTRRCLLLTAASIWLATAWAHAQRVDSLMTKADVIVPFQGAVSVNGFIYYLADDGKTGYELWRTNGTTAGTQIVKDIRAGKSSAFISDSTFYYYADYNSSTGRYDISLTKLKNSLRAFRPFVLNNILYFWADDGVSGVELWRSDGTEAGTRLVADLIPGPISTGSQYDILVGSGGYLGGVNGGATSGGYFSSRFTANQNKLLFSSNSVSNVAWETDGTAAGTREINYQAVRYRVNSLNQMLVQNNQIYTLSSIYDKGRSYYSLLQDNGTAAPVPLVAGSSDYPDFVSASTRGVIYSTFKSDTKQSSFTLFRTNGSGNPNVLRQIVLPRPASGSRSQYAYNMNTADRQGLFLVYDLPSSPATGKGYYEIWRADPATDSIRQVKRYEFNQLSAQAFTKGDERFYTLYDGPASKLIVTHTADSTGGPFNRFTISALDNRTGALQVLDDNLSQWSIQSLRPDGKGAGTGGKWMIVSRKGTRDPYTVWLTDGRTKQVIKSVGAYDFGPAIYPTDAGLFGVGYISNYDKDRKLIGYKVDVWQLDSTAAGTVRVGQINNYPGGVGTVVSRNGTLYGLSGTILKLTSAPADSIRRLADVRNYGEITSVQVNNESVNSLLGTINGIQIGKRYNGDNLLAIDAAASPRQCLITAFPTTSSRDRLNNWNSRVIVLAPGKDSLMTLKRQASTSGYRGDISQIYYHTLQWVRDSTVVLQSGLVDSIRVRQPGIYQLSLRGVADGCSANSTFQVYNDLPKVQIQRRSSPASGGGAYLVATVSGGYPFNVNGTTPYYNSVWEYTAPDGAVKPIPGGQVYAAGKGIELSNVSIKDSELGTYSLKVTDYATSTAVSTLTVDAAAVGFNADASSAYDRKGACAGSPVSLSTTVTGGKAPYTVRWLVRGQVVSGLSGLNPTYTAVTSQTAVVNPDYTSYIAEITDADGRKVLSDDVLIPVYPAPMATLAASSSAITAGQSVTLTATSANYQYPTYAWAKDGAVVTGVAGRSLTATQAGVYSVTVGSGTPENCRTTLSTTLRAGAGRLPALEFGQPDAGLLVMPNPSDGLTRLNLTLPRPSSVSGAIVDQQGRTIHQWNDTRLLSAVNADIDLSAWPAGVYMIRIEAGGRVYTRKLVKK
ncbi:T9SS type A sorting domain-containing protein [Spirosoma sordidisoli]|uniref:T9SS type A sorting domain-containing protein n=1 Tax=Spirosoma sordidisoli TaxID=2502893 RepID=A0A4Q2UFV1_9BACT|nr:T9SS type A sorting domain-containing protein [Spirosoma sordidisoli]RYC67984.1 T9SS type A sorting domain-containing protein [Spirosoma sordidisoli]